MSKEKGISAATLKWIALVAMTLDHFAASGLLEVLAFHGVMDWQTMGVCYEILRLIGRLAFPIYCFLLTEGYRHTHSRKRYALRLGVFALISEVPFDLASDGALWNMWHQNVFFTLLLGLLALMVAEPLYERGEQRKALAVAVLFSLAAELLKTDYGFFGVAVIVALYFLREREMEKFLVTGALLLGASTMELAAFPSFYLMYRYDGRQGRQPRALRQLFYWFYPLHLLVFGLAVRWLW